MEGLANGSKPNQEMANSITEESVQIRDVWNDNLDEEFEMIKSIVKDFKYVAMDTEFPGHVHNRYEFPRESYNFLKKNVNDTKLVQLGLTFFDEKGNLPTFEPEHKYCVWQFNFREFDERKDRQAAASIELLKNNGIKFNEFREKGVDVRRFGERLMTSGIVMKDPSREDQVHWIVFHGSFDFGYVLKLLRGKDLPETKEGFLELLKLYVPNFYDVKHMITYTGSAHGGLDKIAKMLKVRRIGASHQAGSDSLVTCLVFMKVLKQLDQDCIQKSLGILHGL